MEKISWTDRVRNEEVLRGVEEEKNIVRTIKRMKANWIGNMLRGKCLLKRVTERKIKRRLEKTGKRGRRRKQLLDDLKERRGYYKLKVEALDRTLWRTCFGRGYRTVVRQTTERMSSGHYRLLFTAIDYYRRLLR
jgi:5-hydroxyisourate hydrolase-like protein (transthyretin family)